MHSSGYFVDANLLVLLVVGRTGRDIIGKHRRLQGYTVEDYDLLLAVVEQAESIVVTPNTLTEASNLLGQHAEPERSSLFETLRTLIENADEIVVSSEIASANANFLRLGLTDAALIEAATEDTPLITVDLQLYLAALSHNAQAIVAVNFSHLRDTHVIS